MCVCGACLTLEVRKRLHRGRKGSVPEDSADGTCLRLDCKPVRLLTASPPGDTGVLTFLRETIKKKPAHPSPP